MSSMNQKASFRSGAGSYLLYYWPLFRKSLTRLLILFDLSIHRKLLWCPLPISYWAVPFPNTFVLQLHQSILAEKDVAAIFRVRHAVPYCRRWQQCFCQLDQQHLWWLYLVLINQRPHQLVRSVYPQSSFTNNTHIHKDKVIVSHHSVCIIQLLSSFSSIRKLCQTGHRRDEDFRSHFNRNSHLH